MAHVLNRITKEYRTSVNDCDFRNSDWILNPDISNVKNIPNEYWIIEIDDTVRPATIEEQIEIDRLAKESA